MKEHTKKISYRFTKYIQYTLFSALLFTLFSSCSSDRCRKETIWVASERVECWGSNPQLCYRVKWERDDKWTLMHDPIIGFEHEAGYEYKLRIRIETIDNPAMDQGTERHYLLKVLSKKKVDSESES